MSPRPKMDRRTFMKVGSGMLAAGLAPSLGAEANRPATGASPLVAEARALSETPYAVNWYPFTGHPDSDTCWSLSVGPGALHGDTSFRPAHRSARLFAVVLLARHEALLSRLRAARFRHPHRPRSLVGHAHPEGGLPLPIARRRARIALRHKLPARSFHHL